MLIGQIIKFELRGLGPLGRICTPASGYFYDKTKISKENFRVDYYFPAKILQEAIALLSPTCMRTLLSPSSHLGQITTKIQLQNAKF